MLKSLKPTIIFKIFVASVIAILICPILCFPAFAFSESASENSLVPDEMTISGCDPIDIILVKNGKEQSFTYFPVKCSDFLAFVGISPEVIADVNVDPEKNICDNMIIRVSTVEYETVTTEEVAVCHYDLIEIDTIPKGQLNIITPGTDGVKNVTYNIKKVGGVTTEYVVIDEEIIEEPVRGVAEYGTGGTVTASDGTVYEYSYKKKMEATAYTYVPGKTTMTTATGATLAKGIVAVDPKVIPLHTKMYIASDTYEYGYGVAEDTGGVIKGDIVDLAFMSYDECVQFGRRNMWVYVLE